MGTIRYTISELIEREGEWIERALWVISRAITKESILNYFDISEDDCNSIFEKRKENFSNEILYTCGFANKWIYTDTGDPLPINDPEFVEIHFGLSGYTFRSFKSKIKRGGFDLATLEQLHTKIVTEPIFLTNEKTLFDQ